MDSIIGCAVAETVMWRQRFDEKTTTGNCLFRRV